MKLSSLRDFCVEVAPQVDSFCQVLEKGRVDSTCVTRASVVAPLAHEAPLFRAASPSATSDLPRVALPARD